MEPPRKPRVDSWNRPKLGDVLREPKSWAELLTLGFSKATLSRRLNLHIRDGTLIQLPDRRYVRGGWSDMSHDIECAAFSDPQMRASGIIPFDKIELLQQMVAIRRGRPPEEIRVEFFNCLKDFRSGKGFVDSEIEEAVKMALGGIPLDADFWKDYSQKFPNVLRRLTPAHLEEYIINPLLESLENFPPKISPRQPRTSRQYSPLLDKTPWKKILNVLRFRTSTPFDFRDTS